MLLKYRHSPFISSISVVDVDVFLDDAVKLRTPYVIEAGNVATVSLFAAAMLQIERRARTSSRPPLLPSSFLLTNYLLVKALNCVLIYFMLMVNRSMMDDDNCIFGRSVLLDLLHGRQWTTSFPREVFCDYRVRTIFPQLSVFLIQFELFFLKSNKF